MSSTLPDCSAEQQTPIPEEHQIAISAEHQIAIPAENQIAISTQQIPASNTNNGQVMVVQQKDSINNLSLLASSVNRMEKISSQFRSKIEQLNGLTALIPNKPSDTNSDKEQVTKVYSDFRQSISEIGLAYSELSESYHQFQQYFNQVKVSLFVIYKSIYDKIKTNQVLTDKFLETQQEKLANAETQIDTLLTMQDNFKKELKKKGFQRQATLLSSTINKVEQYSHKKKEVEEFNAELVKKDTELNVEKSKLELMDIEMNITKQQEERLQKGYQETLIQKQEVIDQNKLQQKDLEKMGNDKKQMIAMITDRIKKNQDAKAEAVKKINQDQFNRKQNIDKMFDNTLKEINDLQITQSSRGFIVVLDESGSMSGSPFQNCIQAIREQVRYLKSKFPDDEFCMIQFDHKARMTINKSAVQFVNESDIGTSFNCGGTDFYCAFNEVKKVIPLFDCKVINIMFVTDGGDSSTSKYLKVLRDIKQEYSNNKFQLFGMAFGDGVSPSNIKDCLKEVNGNDLYINANGKKIQSYFEVNVAADLIKAFKTMFEAQSASVEEFNAKDKMRREIIDKQSADSQKMVSALLKDFDDEYEQLTNQLAKVTEDQTNSQTKGQEALQEILNQQTSRFDKKLADQEKVMENMKLEKQEYIEKIQKIQNVIKDLEMQRENFRLSAGSAVDKDAIQQDVKEYEEEINKLGFSSKNHYDQLKGKLANADQIEKALTNFSSQMTASMSHLNQIREFVRDGIVQISDNVETKESDLQFQLSDLIERSMQRMDPNVKTDGLSPADKMKFLIMITSKDEYTRILEDKELNYPLENMYSVFEISDIFKLQKVQQKKGKDKNVAPSMTVDQYLAKVFKEIFHYTEGSIKIPAMSKIQEKIAKLDEKIEAEEGKDEPNESKLEKLQEDKEKLEDQLSEFEEKLESKKQENEEKYQQFIADHRREYDFTRNVIRNIRQAIQLIEYKSRQTNIFQPLQMQGFALEMLEQQCEQINQLAIE